MNAGVPVTLWAQGLQLDLAEREALKSRYEAFCAAALTLTDLERTALLQALVDQNNIPAVFDGVSACPRLDSFPDKVRDAAKELFLAAFDSLKSLKIRDRQYAILYGNLPGKRCPFCGIEPFEAPGLTREDLDHYLPSSHYPFAGANLRNLTPMCGKCNASYKLAKDVICDDANNRRRCFDPYGTDRVEVSLLNSRPFEGELIDGVFTLPAWEIDFIGEADRAKTWECVFKIRPRYKANVLDAFFRDWILHFAFWCARGSLAVNTHDEVVAALDWYIQVVLQEREANSSFLQRATFSMIRKRCAEGDEDDRLADWLSALVRAERASTAA